MSEEGRPIGEAQVCAPSPLGPAELPPGFVIARAIVLPAAVSAVAGVFSYFATPRDYVVEFSLACAFASWSSVRSARLAVVALSLIVVVWIWLVPDHPPPWRVEEGVARLGSLVVWWQTLGVGMAVVACHVVFRRLLHAEVSALRAAPVLGAVLVSLHALYAGLDIWVFRCFGPPFWERVMNSSAWFATEFVVWVWVWAAAALVVLGWFRGRALGAVIVGAAVLMATHIVSERFLQGWANTMHANVTSPLEGALPRLEAPDVPVATHRLDLVRDCALVVHWDGEWRGVETDAETLDYLLGPACLFVPADAPARVLVDLPPPPHSYLNAHLDRQLIVDADARWFGNDTAQRIGPRILAAVDVRRSEEGTLVAGRALPADLDTPIERALRDIVR